VVLVDIRGAILSLREWVAGGGAVLVEVRVVGTKLSVREWAAEESSKADP
jgi:hypothetical protein